MSPAPSQRIVRDGVELGRVTCSDIVFFLWKLSFVILICLENLKMCTALLGLSG